MDNVEKAKTLIYSGFTAFFVNAALNALQIEPFHTYFYIFAWWSLILIMDGANFLVKANSLLINRTREFFLLALWSAGVWFLFEIINVRLENWRYVNVPISELKRWTGYVASYATVLPAIFETAELLGALGAFKNSAVKKMRVTNALLRRLFFAGAVSVALVLLLPRYFFWLTWGAFILLLEPANYRLGLNSLLRDLARGEIRKLYLLLLSGFVCGIIWETLNFQAGARWIYTVPFVGDWKIFEMPVPGYLGFPPFAVECYVIYSFISYLRRGKTHEEGSAPNLKISPVDANAYILAYSLLAAVCAAGIYFIDKYTVQAYIL